MKLLSSALHLLQTLEFGILTLTQTKQVSHLMPRFEIDVDPLDHITADAIGKPGQRVFYIQAWQDQRTVTVLIEKFQLQSLSVGVEQFLAEVATPGSLNLKMCPATISKTRCISIRP